MNRKWHWVVIWTALHGWDCSCTADFVVCAVDSPGDLGQEAPSNQTDGLPQVSQALDTGCRGVSRCKCLCCQH